MEGEQSVPKGKPETRELQGNTQLLRSDRVEAIVVVADDLEYAHASGGALVEYLIHALGREIPMVREEEFEATRRYKRRHLIALGGFGTHRLLSRLYTQGHHYCDDRFPGEGGYVIRTIHRVDGGARNVIMLSGGDEQGWYAATEALCDLLTGLDDQLTFPSTNCVVSRLSPPAPRPEHIAGRLQELARRAAGGERSGVMPVLLGWLRSFDLGGDLLQGTLFRSGITLLQEMERRGDLKPKDWRSAPELWLGRLARLWRNVEERCVFDAAFRSRMRDLLSGAAATLEQAWTRGEPSMRGRAWSGAVLAFHVLGQHFAADIALPRSDSWEGRLLEALGGDLSRELICESSARGQCRLIGDILTVAADLDPGAPEGLALARIGQEWIGTCCSPGEREVTFGPAAASPREVREIAGRVMWLRGPGHPASAECLRVLDGAYAPGAHYPPKGLYGALGESPVGVRWLGGAGRPLLGEHGIHPADYGGRDPRLVHAGVSLRALARTHGEFALMGGTRHGPRSHADTNALLRIEYATRAFLVDLPEAGPDASVHAGVGLSLNGRSYDPPRLARAEAILHAGRLRLVASETMDAGHPLWLRVLCHLPGRGFLLLDRITPQDSGSMTADFTFPMLGEPSLEHDGQAAVFKQHDTAIWLRQNGNTGFTIEAAHIDPASLSGLVEGSPQQMHRVSWQRSWKAKAGVPVTFATELRLHALGRRRALLLRAMDGGPWVCALPDDREITIGLDMAPLGTAEVSVDATAYVVERSLWLAGLRRIAQSGGYIETSAPCAALVDPEGQHIRVMAALRTEVYLNNEGDLETLTLNAGAEADLPIAVPAPAFDEVLGNVAAAAGMSPEEDGD